jgi:hypothetical protein
MLMLGPSGLLGLRLKTGVETVRGGPGLGGRASGSGIVLLLEPIERIAGEGRRERLRSHQRGDSSDI